MICGALWKTRSGSKTRAMRAACWSNKRVVESLKLAHPLLFTMGCLPCGSLAAHKYQAVEPADPPGVGVPGVPHRPEIWRKPIPKIAPAPPPQRPTLMYVMTPRGAAGLVRVQAKWRGLRSRNAVQREQTMQSAVRMVQSTLRRHAARKKFLLVVEEAKRLKAVRRIQRTYRQNQWRKLLRRAKVRVLLQPHDVGSPSWEGDEPESPPHMAPLTMAINNPASSAPRQSLDDEDRQMKDQIKKAISAGKWSLLRDLFAEAQGVQQADEASVSSRPIWADLDEPDSPRGVGFGNRLTRMSSRMSAKSRCLTADGAGLFLQKR